MAVRGAVLSNDKARIKTEHEEQREFISWFRKSFPLVRIFAIPNGEKRSISVALRLKVEGVTPGVPDCFVPEWKLWIEMKRTKNSTVSPEQKDWISYLQTIGYTVFVAKGCDEAIEKTKSFLAIKV